MSEEEKGEVKSSRVWVVHATLAMLLFAVGDVLNPMVAAYVGPFTFFYWLSGSLIVCLS